MVSVLWAHGDEGGLTPGPSDTAHSGAGPAIGPHRTRGWAQAWAPPRPFSRPEEMIARSPPRGDRRARGGSRWDAEDTRGREVSGNPPSRPGTPPQGAAGPGSGVRHAGVRRRD